MDEYEVPKLIPMTFACSDMLVSMTGEGLGWVFPESDFFFVVKKKCAVTALKTNGELSIRPRCLPSSKSTPFFTLTFHLQNSSASPFHL